MNRVDSNTSFESLAAALGSASMPSTSEPDARDSSEHEAAACDPRATQSSLEAEVYDLVHRQVRRLARRGDDVDELTQLAAEQALRGLPSFAGRSRLSTWTFRICFVTIRKRDRWYRRWLKRFTFTADGELPETASEAPGGEENAARAEESARLRDALERLSAKRRDVVMMHDLEQLSVDEIAEIVGADPVAVRSRLRDGRKALAALLADDPFFGDDACRRGGSR